MLKAYKQAAALYRATRESGVLNELPEIRPCIGTGDIWYMEELNLGEKTGRRFLRFDGREKTDLFDHAALAEALVPSFCEKAEKDELPITVHEVRDGFIYFSFREGRAGEFRFDGKNIEQLLYPLHIGPAVPSPDGSRSVFIRDENLVLRDNATGRETRLTRDGRPGRDYGVRYHKSKTSYYLNRNTPEMERPAVCWSPDSRYFLTYRSDSDALDRLPLYQSCPLDGTQRPKVFTYPYAIPGDDNVMNCKLFICDAEKGEMRPVMLDGKQFVLLMSSVFGVQSQRIKWTEDGQAYFLWCDRFFKNTYCIAVRPCGGARVLVHDEYKSYAFVDWYGASAQERFDEQNILYLSGTEELIWHSENEGWSSLYLYDAKTSKLIRRLTPEGWAVRRLRYYDKENRTLYFSAGGMKEGSDPYFQYLCSVRLDEGEAKVISTEEAEHFVTFPEKGGYYIDTFSTVQTAPRTVARDLNGNIICDLVTADLSRILDLGYTFPEPFEALARDGKTKVYGIMIKPKDFDPTKKYPVVEYVYGGAQRINVPKAFHFTDLVVTDPSDGLQSLSKMGFIGIMMDGLATPLRSKEIHDYVEGKHEEACGLEDHVCALKQLAERFSFIDIDRVGLWGCSGGGYATARAMLQFPDFFKVGVSFCGNHDQSIYNAQWGERWCGVYSEENYRAQCNATYAENLKGKIFIAHGDLDDNVHPAASIRLADALIKANKTFDFLLVPNMDHMLGRNDYLAVRRWDYFVKNLMGGTPPEGFKI